MLGIWSSLKKYDLSFQIELMEVTLINWSITKLTPIRVRSMWTFVFNQIINPSHFIMILCWKEWGWLVFLNRPQKKPHDRLLSNYFFFNYYVLLLPVPSLSIIFYLSQLLCIFRCFFVKFSRLRFFRSVFWFHFFYKLVIVKISVW